MKRICVLLSVIMCFTAVFGTAASYGKSTELPYEIKTVSKVNFPAPVGVKAVILRNGNVKVTWNAVPGTTEYRVFRSASRDEGYKLIKTVKDKTYIDKTVYNGRAFYYKIRACKVGEKTVKSNLSKAAVCYIKPKAPVISTKNINGSIKISWDKVYGAEKYYIYIWTKDKKYMKVAETGKLSFTHKKALKNAILYYRVSAVYNKDGRTIKSDKSSYSKVLSRYVNPEKKMVALTFDDGPSEHTKAIVDCLFDNNSAATFFVVGNRIDSYKNTVQHTYKMGCELANHSYSHPILTDLTTDEIKSEINKTNNKIKSVTGKAPALVRVPGGGYNDAVKKAVGKPIIQWSDDTLDWKTRSKSATVSYVMNNVQDGDIVLMHDLHEPTKEAALELIPKLKKKGYQIVTVSELAKYKGYKLKNGTVYFSFR